MVGGTRRSRFDGIALRVFTLFCQDDSHHSGTHCVSQVGGGEPSRRQAYGVVKLRRFAQTGVYENRRAQLSWIPISD